MTSQRSLHEVRNRGGMASATTKTATMTGAVSELATPPAERAPLGVRGTRFVVEVD